MKNSILKARLLRRNMTPAETILWQALRYQKLGFKFRRQQPIEHYIADFCCFEKKLIVELDGSVHDDLNQQLYDQERDRYLRDQGFTVLRLSNNQVQKDLQSVLDQITQRLLLPNLANEPSPTSGEGLGNRGNSEG